MCLILDVVASTLAVSELPHWWLDTAYTRHSIERHLAPYLAKNNVVAESTMCGLCWGAPQSHGAPEEVQDAYLLLVPQRGHYHNHKVLGQRVQGPSWILSRVIICSCKTLENYAQISVSLLSHTQPLKEISGRSGVYACKKID